MNFKNTFLPCFLLLLIAQSMWGQTPDSIEAKVLGWMAKGDTSIFAISNEANNYLDTTQSTTKESFAKKYGRWYNMWNNRFDSTGKTNLVANKMLSYLTQASEYDLICSNGGDWMLHGPLKNTVAGKQNLGIVVTAYTPNANSDTVYIGSNSGGIWRTENANDTFPNWECLTNDPRKPAMGVSSIAVDPNNPLVMYAATGNIQILQVFFTEWEF